MPISIVQRSFSGGEIGPELVGRADQSKFQTGLAQCKNWILQRFGGITTRPGTTFIAQTYANANGGYSSRLLRFLASSSANYVLELGQNTMRIIKTGALVNNSGAATWLIGTTYDLGDTVLYSGTYYYSKTTGNVGLQPNTNPAAWFSMGTSGAILVPTPWIGADVRALQVAQSADVMTVVHPSYPPYEIRRYSDTKWQVSIAAFAPKIAAPASCSATAGAAGSNSYQYCVTAIASANSEESLTSPVATVNSAAVPSSANPNAISWSAVSGASSYNVYKSLNGIFGFIGIATGTTFNDINYAAVTTAVPPTARNPFNSAGNYPASVAYYQQRLVMANTTSNPETIYASRVGQYNNFTTSTPTQSNDAITWTMAGREVAPVRHLLEIGTLIVLTDSSEWTVKGDADGVLRPTSINPQQEGFVGAASVPPVVIQNNALFVQARGSVVRDLRYDFSVQGYSGRDLTIYAPHLFDGFSIVSWTFAQVPQSVVWAVRSDGILLGLTYLREHEVWGWHQHDTDGLYLDVASIPETSEDAVYVITRRTINGVVKEYLERFNTRRVTNVAIDAHFVDCGIVYDGRNVGATTLTINGGPTWAYTELMNMNASASLFSPSDVGTVKILTGSDGSVVYFTINAYGSATLVNGYANKTVPASLRGIATATWTAATKVITGLSHLEGKTVAICADGNGIPTAVVSGGSITMAQAYGVVHVGLAYLPQAKLLDYEQTNAETLLDKVRIINRVSVLLKDTIGLFAGTSTMRELKPSPPSAYNTPLPLFNGTVDIPIDAQWARSAQVKLEQRYPLPATILSVIPRGEIGGTP